MAVKNITIDLLSNSKKRVYETPNKHRNLSCFSNQSGDKKLNKDKKGGYRTAKGHGITMSSASTLGQLAYTYREKEEKPRGMKHIGDDYIKKVAENRVVNDSKTQRRKISGKLLEQTTA